MPHTIICGWRGSGKNVFMVNRALKSKRKVFANFKIKIPNWERLTLVKLMNIQDDCDLFIDEAYNWLESRTSSKYTNVFSSHVLFQLRKTNRNIFTTIQDFSTIDIRFRKQWDYLIECERSPNEHENEEFWDFCYTIHHRKTGSINSYIYKYEDAKKLFKYFDTNEIIEFPNASRIKFEVLKTEPKLLLNESIRLANIIKNKVKEPTRETMALALGLINESDIWVKTIYPILKNKIKLKN